MSNMNSGVFYSTWADVYGDLLKDENERKYLPELTMAIARAICDEWNEAEEYEMKLGGVSAIIWNRIIKPQIQNNIERRNSSKKTGALGGRPVNYEKTIRGVLKTNSIDWNNETLVSKLNDWFIHLNKNNVSTKKDFVIDQINQIIVKCKTSTNAINIITDNLNEGNTEFDYDLIILSN